MTPDRRDLSLKRVVDAIRPAATRYLVWDKVRPGLGLDVWPSGRRSWVYQYRNADGRQRRMTLGNAQTMTPEQAGDAYQAKHAAVVLKGEDPLAMKRARRTRAALDQLSTVDVAGARYVAHLEHASRSDRWPREVARILEKNLGAIAALPLSQLTPETVQGLATSMKGRPVAFNRTRAVLSAIVAHAITTGHWPRTTPNPVTAVPEYPEQPRDRYLRPDEWPRVAAVLRALAAELALAPVWDTRRAQLAALILLALTGARIGALLPRVWSAVDVAERVLRCEPEHKGVSEVPLGLHALAHIESWRAQSGADTRSLRTPMFPGQTRPGRRAPAITSLATLWRDVRQRARLEDFTLHDWRRTFATVAGDVGITDHMIGGLLGHAVPGIRGRYARRTPAALLEAADTVSAEVARRLGLTMPLLLPAPIRGES